MPIQNSKVFGFTRQEIEALTPGQVGVYALFKPQVWIYVGKGDIRARLLAHFNGDNACITAQRPTSFQAEVIADQARMDAREKQLILELKPVCNERVG